MSRVSAGIDIFDAVRDQSWKDVANFVNSGGKLDVLDSYKQTPLHVACASGNATIFDILLNRGCDVNAKDSQHETALHKASASGFVAGVKTLLELSSDVDAVGWRQNKGRTPLHRACQEGHAEVALILLKAGADIHKEDDYKQASLHWAAFSGELSVVQVLLQHGAFIEQRCQNGNTPLFVACLGGKIRVVQYLLAQGCDSFAANYAGTLAGERFDDAKVSQEAAEAIRSLLRAARSGTLPIFAENIITSEANSPFKCLSPFQRKPSIPNFADATEEQTQDYQSKTPPVQNNNSAKRLFYEDPHQKTKEGVSTNIQTPGTSVVSDAANRIKSLEIKLSESQETVHILENELNLALERLVKPITRIIPSFSPNIHQMEIEHYRLELDKARNEVAQLTNICDRLKHQLAEIKKSSQSANNFSKKILESLIILSPMLVIAATFSINKMKK